MALLNRKATETETENVNVNVEVETATENTEVVETKEVAVKKEAGPVASSSGGFWFSNEAVQEVVSTATYGDFPQVIASQGSFQEGGAAGKDLGKWIMFRPIQAKVKKVCSPGSNDDEAKEYFAAAYVGESTMDGRSIEECLEDAKAAGYEKATIKDYIDLYAYIESTDSNSDEFAGEVAVLQLSPMSRIAWQKFSKKLQMRAAFGKLDANVDLVIKAIAKPAKNKSGQQFTHFDFELA